MATRREHLAGRKKGRNLTIDMEEVYRLLDKGMKVNDVAAHLGVSRSTLYRNHKIYQNRLDVLGEAGEEIFEGLGIELNNLD